MRPDEVVVPQETPVRVELTARLQRDGVQAALGVGQLHPLAHLEDAAARMGSRHPCPVRPSPGSGLDGRLRLGWGWLAEVLLGGALPGVGLLGVGHGSTV
ncbi:hypothetical protein GCM10009740_36740 [Terrabacter terrae]|uniref:Uncharacterized protein n=1 Tax=Terrabacter terrae TaxID=318434 RepID=A0ABP5G8J9_9MICO